jgi:hypothetical protein
LGRIFTSTTTVFTAGAISLRHVFQIYESSLNAKVSLCIHTYPKAMRNVHPDTPDGAISGTAMYKSTLHGLVASLPRARDYT